ncbi:MAG: nicotinate (nicotinamide) nucleotide adenylyltransferase [Betaproteobacteria bacterium]|nr:nicotinate (nicotinamide) nucleotide adenylyltransferase [Betaproteobacteria bacterium]
MRPIVLLGGTFDPPHRGHLALLRAAGAALQMTDDLRLLIAADPWQKQGVTPAQDRLAMLQLALRDDDNQAAPPMSIDTRELQRSGPSYTLDTLRGLRAEVGDGVPIVFVLGWDQWLGLPSWQGWQQLTDVAHLCIAPRAHAFGSASPALQAWAGFRFASAQALREQPCGLLYHLPLFEQAVSSTQLRAALAEGRDTDAAAWLHPAVLRYIQARRLYLTTPTPTPHPA